MQPSKERTLYDQIYDRVAASIETGNVAQARSIFTEYSAIDEPGAYTMRMYIIDGYGIRL